MRLIIDSDAHSPAALGLLRWGVTVAQRAWLEPGDVLNTLPVEPSAPSLRRNRASAPRAEAMTPPKLDPLAEIRRLYFKTKPPPSSGTSTAPSIS